MGLVDITKRLSAVEAQSDYVRRWVTENNSLLSSVSAFDKRIRDLEGTGYSFSDLLEDYAALYNENGFGFLFFTDPHDMTGFEDYEVLDHFAMIRTMYENSPAQYVLCGGDWLNTDHTIAEAKYAVGRVPNLMRNQICERSYTVIGNHDLNVERPKDASMTETELANIWFDREVGYYTVESRTCFMFDSGTQSKAMTEYRWTQLDWFANKLLANTKPHLFGVIHIIGLNMNSDQTGTLPELGDNITAVADAFNQRTTITMNEIAYDFTNATGTFHFMLSGHYHVDFSYTHHNIPVVYTAAGRQVDCCYIDFTENKLKTVRVGMTTVTGDKNRTINIVPLNGYQATLS